MFVGLVLVAVIVGSLRGAVLMFAMGVYDDRRNTLYLNNPASFWARVTQAPTFCVFGEQI